MRLLTGLVASILAVLVAFFGGLFVWGRDLPNVEDLDVLEFSGVTRVYAREGQLVGTLTPNLGAGPRVNQTLLRQEQMGRWLRAAVVTSEDRRFFTHRGIDYLGIARGVLRSATGDVEGGSSITQQTVKNTLLVDLEGARTAERKFKEAVLAVQVERRFTKDEILTTYLNVIYWGSGGRRDIIGADAAAEAYFGKDAAQLNLAESVYLATLIPSPGRYFQFEAYRPLMKSLLDRMVEDGRITPLQADNAWRTPIQPNGWRVRYDAQGGVVSAALVDRTAKNLAPILRPHGHFLQTVERALVQQYGRKTVFGEQGLKVYTTMDLGAQRAAERASQNARLPDGATLGIALVQPGSGEVLALVGQKLDASGFGGEWNNAVQSRRQIGSSAKPLLYTLALEKGWKQDDTVPDLPLEGEYQPKNYSGTYLGRPVTLRYSLDHSLNLPTVRLAQQVGVPAFEAKLRDLGLTLPDDGGLSLSIGTVEASPLQMASAYATFANGGVWYAPTVLKRVEGAGGRALPLPKPEQRRIWDARTAYLGLDMIRGVVNDLGPASGGLAWKARIPGWDVGGKTGTTNDVRDLWFVGVTPAVAGAVWVGKQAGGTMPANAYSGDVAAPVWQQAVAGALAGRQPVAYRVPDGITTRFVRGVTMAFNEQRPSSGFGGLFRRGAAARQEAERQAQQEAQQQAAREEAARQEAARQEAQRQAQQQAAQEEAARQETERQAQQAAQEEAARQEAERQAQQAAQEEAARQEAQRQAQQAAQEEAARQEAQRQAQQAAQEEAARQEAQRQAQQAAQEEAARQEAERQAQQQTPPEEVQPDPLPVPQDFEDDPQDAPEGFDDVNEAPEGFELP